MATFEELKEDWAKKYRTPVVGALNPSEWYAACLVVPRDEDVLADAWKFVVPEEADAKLLGKYIEYRLSLWNGEYAIQLMKAAPLDIDRGINTFSFVKTEGGWRYSMSSWTMGAPFFPEMSAEVQFPTLLALLDSIENSGGVSYHRWEKFKAEAKI